MKKLVILVSLGFGVLLSSAQTIDFGNVNEKSVKKDTAYHTITGQTTKAFWVYVKVIEQKPFAGVKLHFDSVLTTTGKDIKIAIPLEFSPKQNMKYNGILIIENKNSVLKTVELKAQGVFSNTYYAATQNKSAESLKTALKTITGGGYKSLGYTSARDYMYATLDNDASGFVECVYTGQKAKFNTRSGANSAGFNCEHTYPQGQFSKNEPMRSDIHHLFPTTASSNSKRGNDKFDKVTSPSWSVGGSKSGGGKFEPRDVQKGATARGMAYFVLRYKDYNNYYSSQEAILRQWMTTYQPTQADIDRNNGIYSRQKNRNPFVDYPQFIDRISSISGTASDTKITSLEWSKSLRHQSGDTANEVKVSWTHKLYNSGNQSVNIDTVYFLKNGSKTMILSSQGPVNLLPNQSLDVIIELHASNSGIISETGDSLIIKTSTIGMRRLSFYQSIQFVSSGLSVGNACDSSWVTISIKDTSLVDSVHYNYGDISSSNNDSWNKLDSHMFSVAGKYQVTAYTFSTDTNKLVIKDTIVDSVFVLQSPLVFLTSDTTPCFGDTIYAFVKNSGLAKPYNFKWNDNSTKPWNLIQNKGNYWLNVVNRCGLGSDSVKISKVLLIPKVSLPNDTSFCEGDSVKGLVLNAAQSNPFSFYWKDSTTTEWYKVKKVEDLWLSVINKCGTGKDTIKILAIKDCKVGVKDMIGSETSFRVFPNPALNTLYLDLTETSNVVKIQVSDLQGKIVLVQSNNFNQIDVSELPSGEYIVQLKNENGEIKTARFLKQ